MLAATESVDQALTRIWIVPIVNEVVNPVLVVLSAAAFVFVLWGIFKFVQNAQDGEKRAEGRVVILNGIIGLVLIFGVYGILNFVLGVFNLDPVHPIAVAQSPSSIGGLGSEQPPTSPSKQEEHQLILNASDVVPPEYLNNNEFALSDGGKYLAAVALPKDYPGVSKNSAACAEPTELAKYLATFSKPGSYDGHQFKTDVFTYDGEVIVSDAETDRNQTNDLINLLGNLNTVSVNCTNEAMLIYDQYGGNLWSTIRNVRIGGPTSIQVSFKAIAGEGMKLVPQYFDPKRPDIEDLPHFFSFVHTHPAAGLPQSLPGVHLRMPPSLTDLGTSFFFTLALLYFDPDLKEKDIRFFAVAPEGYYEYDTTALANKYLPDLRVYVENEFHRSGWVNPDNASANSNTVPNPDYFPDCGPDTISVICPALNGKTPRTWDEVTRRVIGDIYDYGNKLKKDFNFPLNVGDFNSGYLISFQDIYLGAQDASGRFLPNTHTQSEINSALHSKLQSYQNMGVNIELPAGY